MSIANFRNLSAWGKENIEYKSLDDFFDNFSLRTAIHTVWYEGYPIDILIDYKPGLPIVFIWKGNTRRKNEIKLPVFVGFSMVPSISATRISICDPTMYLNKQLGLAWYAGGNGIKIQKTIARIVEHIGNLSKENKIIHTGGSGGGFASLFFSKFNKESLAIPFNPQTDFLKYEPTAVKVYLKSAGFDNITLLSQDMERENIVHDLMKFYDGDNKNNTILYLQNIMDSHVVDHMKPFLESLNCEFRDDLGLHHYEKANLSVFISDKWGESHNPPPKVFLNTMFKDILTDNRKFEDIIKDQTLLEKWNNL